MKVLTICQPYAELIARGEKRVENRTWRTSYRGPLAIHAGKSRKYMDDGDDDEFPDMVFGAVIATVELIDVVAWPSPLSAARYRWLRNHEHVEGPWCFILGDVWRIAPTIPLIGQRGIFDVPVLAATKTGAYMAVD